MVTAVPVMSAWVTNWCSVFHFCSRLHMITSLRQLLHGQASLIFFSFLFLQSVEFLWHAIWVFPASSIANSFISAVQPTKEVCLNLEFFPQHFPFESGWKSCDEIEEDVFPLSCSYCMTLMCSSVRVCPDWISDSCSDGETQNVVLPVSLCQSGVWHWGQDKVIFNSLTSPQLLNRIVQEIPVNSWTLCTFVCFVSFVWLKSQTTSWVWVWNELIKSFWIFNVEFDWQKEEF